VKELEVMRRTNDGRLWSMMEICGIQLEMLWDSGASVTVMSEDYWRKIGEPTLSDSEVRLSGVFSTGTESPMGTAVLKVQWNSKVRDIKVIFVRKIHPQFIGGVDTMQLFGVQLMAVNNIDAALVKNTYTDDERTKIALDRYKNHKQKTLEFLVKDFGNIFMASKFDLGHTRKVQHHIVTRGGPISQHPRRQPMHLESKIDEMIQNLLQSKIIQPCKSPWNSPLVIVGKKDGTIRMCVDYRQLNAVTDSVSFPMPDTHHLLDCLAEACWFSSIDLGQAYYQVELTEESRLCTAFSTKQGQFCFNRMPFGLSTAPATFQRLMHNLLEGMIFKGVLVYLDDILVYAKTLEEHDCILREVFQRLSLWGLKINPEKCQFHQRELVFLGHTVNPDGIRTNNAKIKEIEEAAEPQCSTQLKSFLGLTNYYRRFIKDYAKIAIPLHAAISGCDKQLQWTKECRESFRKLKLALCNAPVLGYPRLDRVFILDTDASFSAIGAVLSQLKENGEEIVIAYGSRHLTAHEKGYCVTRKELLALHEYVLHFKQYLYGKRFVARTDHKALIFMNTTKKPISPQFQTWLANLSEYDFTLQYRKGENHNNADGLSRIKQALCSQCETTHSEAKEKKSRVRYLNSLQEDCDLIKTIEERQRSDLVIKEAFDALTDGNEKFSSVFKRSYLYKLRKQLVISNGLLMVEINNNLLTIVPEGYVSEFIKNIHVDLCHLGIKKIFKYMQDNFYWHSMYETIQQCINQCVVCAKRKIDQTRTKETLLPRISNNFLDQIVVDIAHMDKVASNKRYLVVIIDRFSKLVSLNAVSKQDEHTIFKCILHNWIYRFGKPSSILTDRGRQFQNAFMSSSLGQLQIKQEFSSPYQHQSNGLVERVIRTVRDMIATSLKGKCIEKNWYELLPRIEFSLNATTQDSTKFSPFEIVFGRKVNIHSAVGCHTKTRDEIIAEARINSRMTAEKMKTYQNSIRGERHFKEGEMVLVRVDPNKRNKNDFQYEGPYKIIRFISPHQVEIQFPHDVKKRRIEWLKRWTGFKRRGEL